MKVSQWPIPGHSLSLTKFDFTIIRPWSGGVTRDPTTIQLSGTKRTQRIQLVSINRSCEEWILDGSSLCAIRSTSLEYQRIVAIPKCVAMANATLALANIVAAPAIQSDLAIKAMDERTIANCSPVSPNS